MNRVIPMLIAVWTFGDCVILAALTIMLFANP
jgi:hypothetical protein